MQVAQHKCFAKLNKNPVKILKKEKISKSISEKF